jgi:hypothetical protein
LVTNLQRPLPAQRHSLRTGRDLKRMRFYFPVHPGVGVGGWVRTQCQRLGIYYYTFIYIYILYIAARTINIYLYLYTYIHAAYTACIYIYLYICKLCIEADAYISRK